MSSLQSKSILQQNTLTSKSIRTSTEDTVQFAEFSGKINHKSYVLENSLKLFTKI